MRFSQDVVSLRMSQAATRRQNATVPPFAPLTVLSLGAQAGRHALEGQRDVEKVSSIAHQRGPQPSEMVAGSHLATGR